MLAFIFSFVQNLDPRLFQLSCLSVLLSIQYFYSDFHQNILNIILFVFFGISLEKILNILFKENRGIKSGFITSMALSMLLRASTPYYMVLAIFIALISKRVLRFQKSHIFNPANFAICFMLFFFSKYSWVAVGVWDKSWLFLICFFILGLIVTSRVQRVDTSVTFLVSYLMIHGIRLLWLGDPLNLLIFRFNNLALIIFSFFMISDPKTTPINQKARILFSLLIAIIAFIYDAVLFERNGLFWALIIASPTSILLNKVFIGEKFQWEN